MAEEINDTCETNYDVMCVKQFLSVESKYA